jgi:hypothetical protein
MSRLAEVKSSLPQIVAWVLDFLGETLKGAAPEEIKQLYGPKAKLSLPGGFGGRFLGSEPIAQKLVSLKTEFTKESFTYLLADDAHLLVNGTAIWKNARHSFALVIELDESGPSVRAVIVNQIFHKI